MYLFLLLAVGAVPLQPGRMMEGMAMVQLWQVGTLPRLTVRMAPQSQVPLAGLETANNYTKFLLQTLVLEQVTKSSQTWFSLPLAQTLWHSQNLFYQSACMDPPWAEDTPWALCLCLEWRPAENTVLSVGFFCRVVYCTSRLPSAPPGVPSACWHPRQAGHGPATALCQPLRANQSLSKPSQSTKPW